MGSASEKMDATGGVFDHEQHVQPVEQQRINAEEIGGENPVGLPAKKLPPAGPVAARSGIDAGLLENRPYGTCRTLIAQPGQFTVTVPLTPPRVLGGQLQDPPPQLGWGAPGSPVRWPRG